MTTSCDYLSATSPQGGVVAIVTAAGSGTRLGLNMPKCFATLGGATLVERSVEAMLRGGVNHVIVTAPVGSVAEVERCMDPAWPVTVVEGSPLSRQASVAAGLQAAADRHPAIILVHDAARPLTPPAVVQRVINAVRCGHDAVIPALAVTDTIKEIALAHPEQSCLPPSGSQGKRTEDTHAVEYVVGTPERSTLRAVHTPQGFDAQVLIRAHDAARHRADCEVSAASDDAALVEWLGHTVSVVPSDVRAMKVTTRFDLMIAQMLIDHPGALE